MGRYTKTKNFNLIQPNLLVELLEKDGKNKCFRDYVEEQSAISKNK